MTVGIYLNYRVPDIKHTPKELTDYLKYRSGEVKKISQTNPFVNNDTLLSVEYSIGKAYKRGDKSKKIELDKVMEAVVYVTGVEKDNILSKRRFGDYVLARHLLLYSMYAFSNQNLKKIGRECDRDHTTVIHARKSILNYINTGDEYVIDALAKIKNYLNI